MDINRIITIVRNLKEDVPTNNTGSNGSKAGFSAAATGSVTGYDKLLHEPLLDQDYQTPYGLNYRLSNVFPAAKLTETDVDDMVDRIDEIPPLKNFFECTRSPIIFNEQISMRSAPYRNTYWKFIVINKF